MVAHWCEWLIIYRRNSFSLLWILLVSFLLHSAVKAQKPCTFNFSCYFLFHINSLTHIHIGLDPANTFAHWVDWGPNKFTWRWSRLWKQRAHGEAMTVLSKVWTPWILQMQVSLTGRWIWSGSKLAGFQSDHRSEMLQALYSSSWIHSIKNTRVVVEPSQPPPFFSVAAEAASSDGLSSSGGEEGLALHDYTKLYSFKFSCSMVSLTAAKTNRMFSVSEKSDCQWSSV